MWIEIVLTIVAIYVLWQILKKPTNYPPGLWGLPLFGHLPSSLQGIEDTINQLHKKHGSIASWRVGNRLLVFLFDYQLNKDAFLGNQFVDRPESHIGTMFKDDEILGIVNTSGTHWHSIRRFSLRHLRDLGMGKSRLALAIHQEAAELVKDFKNFVEKPTEVPHSLHVAVLNVVWQMIASTRYQLNDKDIIEFERLIDGIQSNAPGMLILDFFPWIAYIVPEFIRKKFIRYDVIERLSGSFKDFLNKHIDDHAKNLDENDPRDYIDAYLIEMKNQENNLESTMSRNDLIHCLADLFAAGSETTTTLLKWAMRYLASYPEIQKRLQKEVDEVLPKGTFATLEDKPRLPYTEAFLHEVLRHSSIAPYGFMHTAPTDTKFAGYVIPKGAFVFPGVSIVHKNPKYFPAPTEFRPDRFLDSDGKFVNPRDGFMPFGIGRRQCMGEPLARMEALIFLTALVQSLNFDAPPGRTLDVNESNGNPFLRAPGNLELLITNRS